MRNLILYQTHIQNLIQNNNIFPLGYWLDEFSKIVIIIDSEFKILLFSYENSDSFSNFILKKTIELDLILGNNSEGIEILQELMSCTEIRDIDVKSSFIKLLLYKSEEDSMIIVLKSGRYFIFNLETEKFKFMNLNSHIRDVHIEKNKIIPQILCVEMSPNLEHIIVVYSNFMICLFNYEFELINTCELDDSDNSDISKDNYECKEASASWRGDSQFFSVLYSINGGKKSLVRDTKLSVFKGPARADNKVVFSVAENPVNNMSNVVAWQPSGSLIAYFQENTILTGTNKVNDSSLKAGLLFSEKNCLRHGELWFDNSPFDIDQNQKISVKFIKWNIDLPLLLVYIEVSNELTKIVEKRIVNIYHRSNYEWSLKYSFELDANEKLFACKFSDALSLRLYLFYSNSKFQCIDFKLEYQNALSNFNYDEENGTVSVANGNTIKFSPLGVINIPPPMCLKTIQLQNRKLPFIYHWWKNYLFVLSDNTIDIIVVNFKEKSFGLIDSLIIDFTDSQENIFKGKHVKGFIFTTDIRNNLGYFIINKIIEDNDTYDEFVILSYDISINTHELKINKFNNKFTKRILRCGGIFNSVASDKLCNESYFIERETLISPLVKDTKKSEDTMIKEEMDLFSQLAGEVSETKKPSRGTNYFYMISIRGKEKIFNKVSISGSEIDIEETNVYSNFDIIKSISILTYNNEEKLIYLTKNNRLFLNNVLLGMDVTSVEFFKHFLLFTQTSNTPYNTLHIIELNKKDFLQSINNNSITNNSSNDPLMSPDFNYKSFKIRTIERSSLIVTISKVNLVLQMSRGNLETICPRLLVLNMIIDLIVVNRDYKQAFELVRKHKINPNFIYDVDPQGFYSNSTLFVSQVNKVDYINLFLNSLENSISEELIQLDPTINTKEDFKKLFITNKINKVCDEMRKELAKENKSNIYVTSILHTYTKKSPPEYLNALKLVQSLKIEEKNKLKLEELVSIGGVNKTQSHHSGADKALEYLCWVVNAEVLFDFALKTYDFELVIMVAKNTQKDPKEYLPYLKKLQDLNEVDPILMKYQINLDLKMHSDALAELAIGKSKYFDKCLELINKYELYEIAITLFGTGNDPENEDLLMKIYQNYGEFLKTEKKNNLEAGWAYYRSNNLIPSLKCFIDSGSVNEVMTIINLLISNNKNEVKINVFENLVELLDICSASRKYAELEKIYLYIMENENKLRGLSEEHSTYSINNLYFKLMETLIKSKRWKSAYLFYNRITTNNKNLGNITPNIEHVVKEFIEGVNLSANLQLNEFKKNLKIFEEKYNRLLIVQHLKKTQPHLFSVELREKNMEDNVSDSGSVISGYSATSKSKKSSASKTSKTSKMSKKSKQKLSKRNVKEGSPLEEEYLIMILTELKLSDFDVENVRDLIKILNFVKQCQTANELKIVLDEYLSTINETCKRILSVAQQDFINSHPEIKELFPELNLNIPFDKNINSGFKTFKTSSG